jgi:hypothetical protein
MASLTPGKRLAPTVVMTLVILGLLGCGADHAAPPEQDLDGSENGGAFSSDVRLPPFPSSGNCTTGETQKCTVYYDAGNTHNCFVGVQLCVDGSWDEICRTEEDVAELMDKLGYDDPPAALAAGGAGGAAS